MIVSSDFEEKNSKKNGTKYAVCWALNTCSISCLLGSIVTLDPNKTLDYKYLEPNE